MFKIIQKQNKQIKLIHAIIYLSFNVRFVHVVQCVEWGSYDCQYQRYMLPYKTSFLLLHVSNNFQFGLHPQVQFSSSFLRLCGRYTWMFYKIYIYTHIDTYVHTWIHKRWWVFTDLNVSLKAFYVLYCQIQHVWIACLLQTRKSFTKVIIYMINMAHCMHQDTHITDLCKHTYMLD